MIERQMDQTGVDESSRCRDRWWLSMEDEQRFEATEPVVVGEYLGKLEKSESEPSKVLFDGLISIGQKAFLPGDQLIGLTTKLFINASRHLTHLAIRTGGLLGHHKMVPITSVSDVIPLGIQLSLTREQFMGLLDYQSDTSIAEEVDRALWKDVVLRDTDYHEIDVQVRDGVVLLHGHVINSMNQWRAETAVKGIPGILGFKSNLIPDDKLTLEVAGALGRMGLDTGHKMFTKVENGVVVLAGEVSSTMLRDQAEQCVAEIPWVRGIINEICVPGIALNPEDQRILQPLIGKALLFKDGLSVTIQKVVINPHNRRVTDVIIKGRFPDSPRQENNAEYRGESTPERMVLLPVSLIADLTRSGGFIRISSEKTSEYKDYSPSHYLTPDKDWQPPYPYCTNEVLFLVE